MYITEQYVITHFPHSIEKKTCIATFKEWV